MISQNIAKVNRQTGLLKEKSIKKIKSKIVLRYFSPKPFFALSPLVF
jgi:hypothetical protein